MVQNHDRDHTDDTDELLELYVLDLLDESETSRIERRMHDDPAIRERVRVLRGVASTLTVSLDPLSPPDSLKTRLLAEARGDRDASIPADITAERERRSTSAARVWLPWAAAAVLALALLASAAWIINLQNQLDERPEIERYTVAGIAPEISATGELVILNDEEAFLNLSALAQPEAGRVYQVWLIEGDQPQSAGVFLPDVQGRASVAIRGDIGSSELIAVTVEPEGGSPLPTSDPIIVGDLSAAEASKLKPANLAGGSPDAVRQETLRTRAGA